MSFSELMRFVSPINNSLVLPMLTAFVRNGIELEEPKIVKTMSCSDCPIIVVKYNAIFNGIHPDVPQAGILFNKSDGVGVIAVNDGFLFLPDFVYDALIAHELGHFELCHPPIPREVMNEVEADEYAIKRGHKSGLLKGFEIMCHFTELYSDHWYNEMVNNEMVTRIEWANSW